MTLLLSFVIYLHTLTVTLRPPKGIATVEVAVQSDDYFRSSMFHPEDAAHAVRFRDLPSGEYTLDVLGMDAKGEVVQKDHRGFFIR